MAIVALGFAFALWHRFQSGTASTTERGTLSWAQRSKVGGWCYIPHEFYEDSYLKVRWLTLTWRTSLSHQVHVSRDGASAVDSILHNIARNIGITPVRSIVAGLLSSSISFKYIMIGHGSISQKPTAPVSWISFNKLNTMPNSRKIGKENYKAKWTTWVTHQIETDQSKLETMR